MEGILLQGSITILAIIVTYITTARKSAKEIKQLGANIELVTEQKENLDELLAKYPEARQMPQIFIDDQRVGGLAGLNAALAQLGL